MNHVLLLGNGVNNLTNKESWSNLLKSTAQKCDVAAEVELNHEKPFPLLYEEIYLLSSDISELSIKRHIAKEVKNIKENEIHQLIREKKFRDIITTNYEYILQGDNSGLKNKGVIKESKYSVFRHNIKNDTRFWHIHGECNIPASITLGYEHYGGQLQQMRNYVVSGTNYTKKKNQKSLSSRLKLNEISNESWIDLFFNPKTHIHILGLKLDFVETDIWWLLTIRARFRKVEKFHHSNEVSFYVPEKYFHGSKQRIALLKSIGINIVKINKENHEYYKDVLKKIQ